MQNQRRGGGARSGTTEAKTPAKGREADPNNLRMIFVLTSLVGQRVTAKLRDNVMYEGIFHSFSSDNDFAIVLKSARKLASEMSKSGKVMDALIIPGKDFLQISALDVPSPSLLDKEPNGHGATGFKTDTEISQKANIGGERELVSWAGSAGEEVLDESLNSGNRNEGAWDQFAANEQMFGVSTTFNEDLYTTKLDPSLIPRDKREEAERLAREIELGPNAAEKESQLDGEDDEEGRFSAVHGTGAYQKKVPAPNQEALEALRQQKQPTIHEDAKRNLASTSPSMKQMPKTSMISEMKRINALNLEPAVPKFEDKAGNDLLQFQQQSRNANKSTGGNGLKMEFQQSLELINKREATKQQQQQQRQQQQEVQGNSSSDNWRGGGGKGGPGNQLSLPPEAIQQGNMMQQQQQQQRGGGNMQMAGATGDSTRSKSSFSFNPNAKDFTFNPSATSFTPNGSSAASGPGQMAPNQQPSGMAPNPQGGPMAAPAKPMAPAGPSPPFNTFPSNNRSLETKLEDILDCFYNSSKNENLAGLEPIWPEAQGPSYHDVLGQPNPGNPPPPLANAQPMGAPWQQQQQQPMGQAPPGAQMQGGNAAPQMMNQQGFMVAPAGQNNQMNQQMFQPMYQGPGGQMPPQNQMPAQRPQNNNVPSGMVNPQGGPNQQGFAMQPMPGGAMPKFGGQGGMPMQAVMMVPPGHYPQAQFQQQGQPGQPGPQPGGPPGGPQPQGHWQQGHQMPVHMQQVGPRGPPHPMSVHDGG